jgi:hypothetical protein
MLRGLGDGGLDSRFEVPCLVAELRSGQAPTAQLHRVGQQRGEGPHKALDLALVITHIFLLST